MLTRPNISKKLFEVGQLVVQGGQTVVQGGHTVVQGGQPFVQSRVSSTVNEGCSRMFYVFNLNENIF